MEFGSHPLSSVVQLLVVAAQEDDIGTLARKAHRNGEANAACCARDEGLFLFEVAEEHVCCRDGGT